MEPNALLENGVAAAGAAPPNAEPPEEPPKGLGSEPTPVPNALLGVELNGGLVGAVATGFELNGELSGARAAEVVPKGDLFSPPPPPPNADVLDVGAVVADDVVDTDAPLDTAAVEPNGDLFSPPPKGDFEAPNEAVMFPKPNDVPADEGGAGLSSNGLDVLYF